MVSGLDINLDTLKLLKEKFQGYIHMDLHNIVMRTGNDGTRFRGPVRDWLNWSTNCDTLQMNEAEASVISTEGFKEYNTAEKILRSGKVKAVIITRGNRGVMMYRIKSGNSSSHPYDELDKTELPPVETQKFKDSTGCGDVFASAFFYKSIENNQSDFPASLHFANRMASLNSELEGVEELGKLND
jgi:sugar/nucleoside kinase (ribokinase family)